MSLSLGGLTTYVEENKLEMLQAAIAKGKTASLIQMRTGIKETSKFPVLSTVVTLAADGCARVATGTTAITQVSLTVGDIMVAEDLCIKTLKSYYLSTQMKNGSWDEAENPFEAEFMANKTAQLQKVLEVGIWQGDTGSGTNNIKYFDGLIKLIDAGSPVDGNADGVTAAVGILKSNVVDIFWGMVAAIPEQVREADDLILFVGMDTFSLYERALYEANMFNYSSNDNPGSSPFYGASGIQIEAVHGLTGTNRCFLASASNLFVGTDMEGEDEDIRLYENPSTTSLEYTSRFKYGTACGIITEVVEFTLVP